MCKFDKRTSKEWPADSAELVESFAQLAICCSEEGHSGPGYYLYEEEYPDEGSFHLGTEDMAALVLDFFNRANREEG